MENDALIAELLRDFNTSTTGRANFEGFWEQVARIVLPYYVNTFTGRGDHSKGTRNDQELYDFTANAALWRFSSIMEWLLTPSNSKWHRIRPTDSVLKRNRGVMRWFEEATDAHFHYRYSPHSGFQGNMSSGYVSIGAFGTGCLFTDAFNDPTRPSTRGLRYRNVHLGELYFAENHQGQIDKVYRRFKMTLRQMAQKWGKESLPEGLRSKLEKAPETEATVLHIVRPNNEFEPGRLDARGKRFASFYLLMEEKVLLESGGYRCNPYSVARYLTAPGETYGRGPAMNALPSIKVLNEEKKQVLKQGHRALDPILLVHDDGIIDGFSFANGALNSGAVSAEGRALVQTLPTGNIAAGKDLMDDERAAINDTFLITLFQIMVETPTMTATEVVERAREKGALLSPTMGRFQAEGLGPLIEREFDLLMYQGLISPMPQMLIDAGAEYEVEYDAPLNRMMRAEEAAGGMRTFQFATEMAAQLQDPSILDPFDTDAMIPDLAEINAMPSRWLRTPEDIAARRQGRQAEQATQQITQALPGMAAMVKATAPKGTALNVGQQA
jgi:hypothetical protein